MSPKEALSYGAVGVLLPRPLEGEDHGKEIQSTEQPRKPPR